MPLTPVFSKENSLGNPVSADLHSRGYRKQCRELKFYEYSIDIYGYDSRDDRTVAVELKLHRWMRAFEQAIIYQLCADLVYIAVPQTTVKRVDKSLLRQYGIGLIGVGSQTCCELILESQQSKVIMSSYRDFYIGFMKKKM